MEKYARENESIRKLNAMLHLQARGDEQDWAVELADPRRIGEFLALYENDRLDARDRFALMELIVASVDAFVQVVSRMPVQWKEIADLLVRDHILHGPTIAYWADAEHGDPDRWFALTPQMRGVANRAELSPAAR